VGWARACALVTSGGVKCWGYNRNGVHNCALTQAGGASCWGDNSYGMLGDGTTGHARPPAAVIGLGTPSATVAVATSPVTLCVQGFAIPSGAKRTVVVALSRRGHDVLIRAGRRSAEARASHARTPGVTVATTRTIVLVAPSGRGGH
jgi:Regulator of Chromosome Condensation (RCC1) repeat protein